MRDLPRIGWRDLEKGSAMTDKLTQLLRLLPAPGVDRSLDSLEPLVWARIEKLRGARASAMGSLRFQLAAAGMALVIGVALGWAAAEPRDNGQDQSLYASYADVGPAARLSGL
jgi:hypothetical protein